MQEDEATHNLMTPFLQDTPAAKAGMTSEYALHTPGALSVYEAQFTPQVNNAYSPGYASPNFHLASPAYRSPSPAYASPTGSPVYNLKQGSPA